MMMKLPRRAAGSHFYKYGTQVDWLERIILKNELFFPELRQMKDPTDGRPKLAPTTPDQLVAVLHKYWVKEHPGSSIVNQQRALTRLRELMKSADIDKIRRELAEKLYALSTDKHRVYCLSKRWNNLSMWENFAGNHSGYCLEFANDGCFPTACEVEYGDSPLLMDITDPEDRGPYCFFKLREYSGEEEVRVTLMPGSDPVSKIESRCLTRVILGSRMSDADKQRIRQWAEQREPKVPVVTEYFDALDQVLKLRGLAHS